MKAMKSFGETDGTFLVAFKGDGYPLGKKVHAPSFIVLNVGKRVASSADNFHTSGINCNTESLQ